MLYSLRTQRTQPQRVNSVRNGFTLIELMITLAVLAVMALLAGPAYQEITAKVRVKAVSSDLFVAMTQARSTAVKRNGPALIKPKTGGWAKGWQVFFDTNNDGSLSAGEVLLNDQAEIKGVTIAGGPAAIAFLGSGRIRSNITLPLGFSITSDAVTGVSRCVTAEASGRPYVKEEACS